MFYKLITLSTMVFCAVNSLNASSMVDIEEIDTFKASKQHLAEAKKIRVNIFEAFVNYPNIEVRNTINSLSRLTAIEELMKNDLTNTNINRWIRKTYSSLFRKKQPSDYVSEKAEFFIIEKDNIVETIKNAILKDATRIENIKNY